MHKIEHWLVLLVWITTATLTQALTCDLAPVTTQKSYFKTYVSKYSTDDAIANCKKDYREFCEPLTVRPNGEGGTNHLVWGYNLTPLNLKPQDIWQQICLKALKCQNDLFNAAGTDEASKIQREQIASILIANKCNPP